MCIEQTSLNLSISHKVGIICGIEEKEKEWHSFPLERGDLI